MSKSQWTLRASGVLVLLLIMAVELVHGTRVNSATWDEPHHLFDGYTIWKQGDFRLNPEVPPLVKLVAALPLLANHLAAPPNQGRSEPKEAFLDGRKFVFGNGAERTLEPARLACMSFTLLLGVLLYLFAGEAFGYKAGLIALAFFVFDPSFLAHGALVTTDVGCACLFLAAVYAFYRYARRPSVPRLLLCGLVAGLLLAAKFTGLFLLPMLVIAAALEAMMARSTRVLWHRLAAVLVVSLCAWTVLWGCYGFRYKAAPPGRELSPTLPAYLEKMYDKPDAARLAALARFHVLPEAYLWGLENTKQTEWEDTSYFWGRVYRHGNWEYFPVAFLIKSTLPFLLLLGLATAAFRKEFHAHRLALAYLLTPVIVYFAIVTDSDFDIGIRHLLPVYAFFYVLVAGGAALLLARDRRWALPLAALFCWQVVTSVRAAPAYMAYGNEAWGGPSAVHRYLSDANTDWGQQLLAVKTYLAAHPATDCWFAYFPDGAIEPSDYGIRCKRLPTTNTLWWLDLPMKVPPVISGIVLISDSDLQGIEFGDGALNPYNGFRALQPTASLEYGVNVYKGTFTVPLASALVTAHGGDKLLKAGKVEDALREAQAAAQLAPASAVVQAEMGDVLAAQGRPSEALAHYRSALQLAETVRPDLQADAARELRDKIATLARN